MAFIACAYLIYIDRKHFKKVEKELDTIEKELNHK